MSWKAWFQDSATRALNWMTRRRSAGGRLLYVGGAITACTLSTDWLVSASVGKASFVLSTGEGQPALITKIALFIGLGLVLVGAILSVSHHVAAARRVARKLIVSVELRGLPGASNATLRDAMSRDYRVQCSQVFLDVRDFLRGGEIEGAIRRLGAMPELVLQQRGTRDAADVMTVVGGLLPVPLLFYAGSLLDDEGSIVHVDWDRSRGRWRQLEEADDGTRFRESLPEGLDSEVVLAVSASYVVNFAAVTSTFGSTPMVTLALQNPTPNTLWSDEVQSALTNQFLQMLAKLGARGVEVVHLVLAAPSSLVLRFGRSYDARNMPAIQCYQYERDAVPPYPWAVDAKGQVLKTAP